MTHDDDKQTRTRFKITDDTKGRRLRIRWRDASGEDCSKDFSYKMKAKSDQIKAAEEFQAALIKQTKRKVWKPRSFGTIIMEFPSGQAPRWNFTCALETGKYTRSFSIKKYGDYGAFFRAEEARRAVFPEWGNEEDIYCDDLGHIEWD